MKLLYLVESGKSKFLVFDEMPDKISTKYGDDTIIGRIGGIFYDFLAKRNERRGAFGGRKFDVVLDNGEVEKCEGVQHGDWVRCVLCGAQMLLPCGADKCPECGENGTLRWVDEEKQEMDAKDLDCLGYVRELRIDDYLSPTTLEEIAEEIKKKVNRG